MSDSPDRRRNRPDRKSLPKSRKVKERIPKKKARIEITFGGRILPRKERV
jgi:hypothetical protein